MRVGDALPARTDVPSSLRREVTITFDSAAAVDDAGIAITPAWPGAITAAVDAPGEVRFDPTLVTRLGSRAAGPVWRILKTAGDPVAAGDVLALVDATAAGQAKAAFQQSLVQARLRNKTLADLKGRRGGGIGAAGAGSGGRRRGGRDAVARRGAGARQP